MTGSSFWIFSLTYAFCVPNKCRVTLHKASIAPLVGAPKYVPKMLTSNRASARSNTCYMSAPTQDRYKRASSAGNKGVASIVARRDTTPRVGNVFAPVSPNWFVTNSRCFGFGCIRVSPIIGNRNRLNARMPFPSHI